MDITLAVPPAKIASGTLLPRSPLATSVKVPSPPLTATASAPPVTASFARRRASPASLVTNMSQSMPASPNTLFSVPRIGTSRPAAGLTMTWIRLYMATSLQGDDAFPLQKVNQHHELAVDGDRSNLQIGRASCRERV